MFEDSLITNIMKLTSEIQMSVYRGQLSDSNIVVDWLMNKETIMPRLNPRILSNEKQFLQVHELDDTSKSLILKELIYLSQEKSQKSRSASHSSIHTVTLWVVCDPDTERGRQLLYDAINYQDSSRLSTRLAIILKKSNSDDQSANSSDDPDLIKKAIYYVLSNYNIQKARLFIKTLLKEKSFNEVKVNKKAISKLDFKTTLFDDDESICKFNLKEILDKHSAFLSKYTPFKSENDMGLVVNGRILGPFDSDEAFIDSDFSLMENYILKTGLRQLDDALAKWDSTKLVESNRNNHNIDDLVFMIYSLIGKYSSIDTRV